VLIINPGIANLIRENKTFRINSAIQTGAKYGMQLLDDHLFRLWKEEKVILEEVLAKAHNPDELAKRIVNYQRGIQDELPPGGAAPDDPMARGDGSGGGDGSPQRKQLNYGRPGEGAH
jgi:twitching motility protein PilT